MRRVTHTGQPLIEPRHPLGPHELPSTLRYLNDRYFDFERALPYPRTDDPVAWRSWRGRLRRALRRTLALPQLGPVPLPQPLVLETIECDGYRRHKLAYETLPGNWARAYLLVPDDDDEPAAPRAAVLCPHGHVNGNSRAVADPEQAAVANVGVPYAHEFAVRGLVALAPEHAGMGERGGGPEHDPTKSPGACQALWVRLNHMGLDLTGLRVFDLMAALNLLAARPDVDSRRIGCAGLSGGCWLSQVLTAMDRRVRAVVLSGFFTTFVQTVWHSHCICHHPFGIGRLCDMPDISALIAPRPQFVESGDADAGYPYQPAFDMVREAYTLLGAREHLGLHRYTGGHMFHGGESIPWMVQQLSR